MSAIIPIPRCEMSVRVAGESDYAFIDRLQDMHSKALGFMPKAQLQGKIKLGHVLIAEDEMRLPIAYCMSQDRYFKRDDVGIIYQMNVSPGSQRKLVGAMLLKAVFERAAYGCRLFCCWCAQDLDANYFWESMGFVPLAFRAGAKGKRAHIFWQRRIREGDTTTPYWFPSKTDGGMMREDRIVLPIPAGVHWRDEMPILLPVAAKPQLPAPVAKPNLRMANGPTGAAMGKLWFTPPKSAGEKPEREKPRRQKAGRVKADPAHVAKARELRDRWLEKVNADPSVLLSCGKYEVSKQLTAAAPVTAAPVTAAPVKEILQLPHAVAA
jgi:hypothetical protein